MKNYLILAFLFLSIFALNGQGYTKKELRYKPVNLEEAILQLTKILPDTTQQKILSMTEEEFLAGVHFGLGMWIRNNWRLWQGGKLANDFKSKGIFHPDDMSGIILTCYYRRLHNQEWNVEKQVKFYQTYWKAMQDQQMEPVYIPEKFPEYPGGKEELQKFFINNLVYPKEAKEKGIEEIVLVDLIIEEDGTFSNVKLSSDKYDLEFTREAIRIIKLMPKWIPGQINGKNVRTYYLIPVIFSLDNTFDFKTITQEQNLEKYRLFSTDIIGDSTDSDGFVRIYKEYNLKLYQDGLYKMSLSETHSHIMFYDAKVRDYVYSDMIFDTIISEGSYIEQEQILTLMDKNNHTKLEYQFVCDTIIRLPVFPNEIQMCLIPIQTFPFLNNIHFREE